MLEQLQYFLSIKQASNKIIHLKAPNEHKHNTNPNKKQQNQPTRAENTIDFHTIRAFIMKP